MPHDRAFLVPQICEQLQTGKPLTQICVDLGVGYTTTKEWRREDSEIERQFREARVEGGHAIAERARKTARGKNETEGGESTGDIQRDKLIIDLDMRLLSKWFKEQYGDHMTLANDAQSPLIGMSDEQINARFKALMDKAKQTPEGEDHG